MPPVAWTWKSFFDRIKDVDPDLRSMALFDLQTELEKPDFQLGNDADLCTAKIISCFSKEENNSEVHSQALKLVPVLISKQGTAQRKALLDHLCLTAYQKPSDVPVDKVRAMRDNATGALKGAIPALVGPRADSATTVAQGLLPGLKSDDVKVRTEIFTVLAELLKTLGASVEAQHQAIVDASIAAVGESNEMLRKKATICLAAATSVCNTAEFEKTMEFTVGGLRNNQGEKQRRHVQLVSAISRAAGGRFSTWVSRVMPLLFAQLKRLDEITDSDVKESPESDDTREHILQALDNIIARCPLYVTESLPEVIKYAASLVSWDPNFCESSDADNDDEGDDEDLLDGDDNSWKVRKSAVKCLLQIVKARPDTLKAVVTALLAPAENGSPLLISRFNERVENVRLDVLDLFRGVISACRVNASPSSSTSAASSGSSTGLGSFVVRGEETLRQEAQLLHPLRDEIIKNLLRSAKHKSVKVKLAVHVLLKDLYIVMGRELGASVNGCAALVAAHLKDPKLALPQLRPDVLDFARVLVQVSHRLATATEDESLITSILTLLDPAVKCTEEKYYRTVVAALKLLNEFVAVVAVAPNSNEVAQKIFDPLFTRLSATDADQEVRRAAMEALALLLREAEKPLVAARAADVQKSFDLIVALLKGETTRVSAARSVGLIQRCALQPAHLTAIVTELTSFLRKLDRQVREQGLRTLASFVTVHNAKIDAASLASIIAELTNDNSKLLSEMELFLTVLALQLGKAIAAIPTATKVATERLVPAILNLLRSPLTQGQSVSESAEVLALLARDGSVSASLFAQAVGVLGQVTDEAAVHNLSAAVGVLCSSEQDTKKRAKNVDDLVKMSTSATKAVAVGGITSLGEAGRWMSLVAAGAASALEKALQSPIEEVKTAASAALGRAASREQGADLLEKLVQSIATETPELLLRLRSLRDCFVAMAADNATSAALARLNAPLFDALVKHAASSNESVAEATSECLGRLAQASPGVVALVAGKLSSVDDKPRATILGAMRFTMPHHASPQLDEAVRQRLPTLLSFLDKAQTPATRRAALQLLTAAAYNRPAFINTAALRDVAFTRLLEATVVDVSLITTVDLGPFKHTTDHGADLRKQAFECLSVFADSLSRPGGILELTEKFDAVVATLTASLTAPETDFDIWASARSTIVKVARHGAGAAAILANASPLANNLKAMVGQKLKEGQDKERVDDANKGAAICAYRLVNAIPALMQNAEVQALLKAADAAPFSAAAKQAAAEE